jgi:anhydro-N-acetylmuramic acid kinase
VSVAPLRELQQGPRAPAAPRILVGLMSGTSLDGISAVVVRFHDRGGRVAPELLGFSSRPYTAGQRDRLSAAMTGTTPAEYCRVNFDLGGWLADAGFGERART